MSTDNVIPISLSLRRGESLTRLAVSLTNAIEQPDAILLALGVTRDGLRERLGYITAEITARFNHGTGDQYIIDYVYACWGFAEGDDLDAAILALPAVHLHQLPLPDLVA